MKNKTIAILAAAAGFVSASNINAQELSWEATYGVESEYVFRGVKIADESIQGGIEGSYADAYFGVWAHEAFNSDYSDTSEFDFYAGYGVALDDTYSLDFGGTLYHYPDADGDDTVEAFIGLTADVQLAPSLYFFYDFDIEAITVEGAIGHSIEVDSRSSVDLGAAFGYVDIDNDILDADYIYYSATADYVYSISESTDAAFGVRYSNNDIGLYPHEDGNLWGGVTFTTSF
ncbi:TorF family putative porin [Pelagicoccus mobilis]|uniref:Uncharacterized protein n=1 Tax=Pelagicoccus mobilis TaxID=415221 RepID=A0A934VSC0_9BACT|nr:TorF family putative porin [Pelagicoccus mobilis]MBK1878855.1 hypothetical protein [Pelagicoccus mobilis]